LRENIRFFLASHPGFDKQKSQDKTELYLAKVGLTQFANYYPHEASGGMKRRISIARCFASEADILLLDEPFVFLDYQIRMKLYALLYDIWRETRRTIIFVTHDVEEAVLLSSRIMLMSKHPGKLEKILNIQLDRSNGLLACKKLPSYINFVDKLNSSLLPNVDL